MLKQIRITRTYDIRPLDYRTGKREPIDPEMMQICSCCGKKIAVVSETAYGHTLGKECVTSMQVMSSVRLPDLEAAKRFHVTKKQFTYFQSHAQ